MKKTSFRILLMAAVAVLSVVFAGCESTKVAEEEGPKVRYITDYGATASRIYYAKDYLNGVYRPNFRNIPQKSITESGMGVFNLDGTELYVYWENNTLVVCSTDYELSADGKTITEFYITKYIDGKEINYDREVSFFSYENLEGMGLETKVTIKGKDYIMAVAGRNTDKDGFRMWIEESDSQESAVKKTSSSGFTNYEFVDIYAGVYKPGYKRLWGKVTKDPKYTKYTEIDDQRTFLYEYNGTEFIVGSSKDVRNRIHTADGKVIEPSSEQIKVKVGKNYDCGFGWEKKITFGDKTVDFVYLSCNGYVRIWVKE